MLYVLKRGVKKVPFELHILINMILVLNTFFVYRVLLMFI